MVGKGIRVLPSGASSLGLVVTGAVQEAVRPVLLPPFSKLMWRRGWGLHGT